MSISRLSHEARSGEILDALLGLTGMALWELDLASERLYGDERLKKMLGLPAEEWENLSMSSWAARVHQDDLATFEREWQRAQDGEGFEALYRLRLGDGRWRWVHDRSTTLLRDSSGRPAQLIGVIEDVTRRQERRSRWQHLVRSVPGVIYTFTMDTEGSPSFLYISEQVRDFYGLSPAEVINDSSSIFNAIHPEDLPRVMSSIQESLQTLGNWRCEYRVRADDEWRWIEGCSSPERQPDGSTVWHGLIYSIDDRKRLEEQLHYLSITDELTELYNRRYLLSCMKDGIARYRRYGTPFTVVTLDIDHFKQVNDRHGHNMGDEVLKRLAALFRTRLRETDIAGRSGGEEFLLLLPATDEASAHTMAESLRHALAREHFSSSEDYYFRVTLSAGVASVRDTTEDHSQLWARADKALYRAKSAGRNRVICG